MKEVVLGIWLGIQSGFDFKQKEIPVGLCIWGALLGGVFCVVEHRSLESIFLSLLPGVVSLIFSRISKEVIGYGDGMVLLVMAFFLSVRQQVSILMMALLMAGVVALILLLCFRRKGSYRMPFIPFLFLAFLIEYYNSVGGARI